MSSPVPEGQSVDTGGHSPLNHVLDRDEPDIHHAELHGLQYLQHRVERLPAQPGQILAGNQSLLREGASGS
ncbi:MAG: hypothetical protein OXH33_02605 [bacterium]|nr:hypothetical protein [bacterium]